MRSNLSSSDFFSFDRAALSFSDSPIVFIGEVQAINSLFSSQLKTTLTHPSIQTPVLDRLRDVFSCDIFAAFDIGYRSRHFKDAIICPGGKAEAVHGRFHEILAGLVDPAVLADVPRLHVRVRVYPVAFEPFLLRNAGPGHASADR